MPTDTDRRRFLTTLGAAAGSTVLGLSKAGCATSPPAETTDRPSHLVRFGHTDLWVSKMCQGTAFRTHLSREGDSKEAHDLLRHCIDVGINFFDTAEAYGSGESEIALGHGIAGRRHEVVISTKAYPRVEGEKIAFTEPILRTRVEASLKRLGTDYIDIYLLHSPDRKTPSSNEETPDQDAPTKAHMEEIAAAMTALVESGKIRYWGVSNHLPRQVEELLELGNQPGRAPLAGLQDYFTVVAGDRRSLIVEGLFPLIRRGNLGLMAFSPLGGGSLVPGREVPEGSALMDMVKVLDEVARELGVTRPQVCVAWVAAHPEVTSVLAGGEKPEHVEENLKGTELKLPASAMARLNAAAEGYAVRMTREKMALRATGGPYAAPADL